MRNSAVFFGSTEQVRPLPSARASLTHYRPLERIPSHPHIAAYLSIAVAGSYSEKIGRRTVECVPFTVRYHPAGEEHSNEFGARGGRCLNLELSDAWEESLLRLPNRGDEPLLLHSAILAAVRAHEAFLTDDDCSALELEELIATLLLECSSEHRIRSAGGAHCGVQRAQAYVRERLANRLELREIAAASRLHPTHLARAFRERTGLTIGAYVRRLRVQRVAELLRSGRSVSYAAAAAGFADHAHLSRTFRSQLGMTPSDFQHTVCSR